MSAGKRIGSGHLRVDAAKAIAKLRDYQLPDPLQWVLECFRGAVGLGAEAIFAWGDADDVWLAWRGKAPDPEELAKTLAGLRREVDDRLGAEPAVEVVVEEHLRRPADLVEAQGRRGHGAILPEAG